MEIVPTATQLTSLPFMGAQTLLDKETALQKRPDYPSNIHQIENKKAV